MILVKKIVEKKSKNLRIMGRPIQENTFVKDNLNEFKSILMIPIGTHHSMHTVVLWLISRHRSYLAQGLHLPESHFIKKPYFYHYYLPYTVPI